MRKLNLDLTLCILALSLSGVNSTCFANEQNSEEGSGQRMGQLSDPQQYPDQHSHDACRESLVVKKKDVTVGSDPSLRSLEVSIQAKAPCQWSDLQVQALLPKSSTVISTDPASSRQKGDGAFHQVEWTRQALNAGEEKKYQVNYQIQDRLEQSVKSQACTIQGLDPRTCLSE